MDGKQNGKRRRKFSKEKPTRRWTNGEECPMKTLTHWTKCTAGAVTSRPHSVRVLVTWSLRLLCAGRKKQRDTRSMACTVVALIRASGTARRLYLYRRIAPLNNQIMVETLTAVNRQQPDFDKLNSTISEIVEWFTFNNILPDEKKRKIVTFSVTNTKLVDVNEVVRDEMLDIVDRTLFLGLSLGAGVLTMSPRQTARSSRRRRGGRHPVLIYN
ncbi:hypothetical protein EVAR_59331_1 [Eumeta japonica]|uniref:Uncharacterized protein n=1 Tax=Eumeta variegata TaxID=151549 RepID=A0A4C1YN64_EUMVA|nr:hypothetical protein EVAR_59331_1 [Eumeta japonica]